MNVGSTIAQSILLTFFWMIFAYAGRTFSKNEPPRAVIVPAEFVEIEPNEEIKKLPESIVQAIQSGQGSPVMTQKALKKATDEYQRNQWLLAGLNALSGLATFFIGLKLFGHWGYASATLALGPIIVAYYFRYVANSPPAPNMPSS
ncbi:hypothetical protein N9D63_09185 [Opitutales bacterium]|nr:hypothetical protein [Opitutales bacterium]